MTKTVKIILGGGALVILGLLAFMVSIPPAANDQVNPADLEQAASGLPARLVIPSIHVDAEVIYVGLTADGAVDTPKGPDEVAWFQLGPRPGDIGSAVMTGHFGPWQTGASSVFDRLHELKVGDTISVKDDKGAELSFVVTGTRIYGPNETAPEVFNTASGSDGRYLNLITCSGDWLKNQQTYTERRVIFTELVEK